MDRANLNVGLLLCIVAGAVALADRSSVLAQASSCTPVLRTYAGNEVCYPPPAIAQAEQRIHQVLNMPPVRPVSAVSRLAHLHLQQVLVLETEVAAGGRPQPYAIFYLVGKIARGRQGFPDPTTRTPKYLVVSEIIGLLQQQRGVTVSRGIGIFRLFTHSTATPSYQPWNLDANLPGRNLALHITSNTSRQVVKSVGKDIIVHSSLGR